MSPEDHARNQWQTEEEVQLPDIETLRARTRKFHRQIARRNALEYLAGAFLIAAFGGMLVLLPLWPFQLAAGVSLAGVCYVMWQLHARASYRKLDERMLGAQSLVDHRRGELVRQRDALAGIFGWYLAPLLPGLLLFYGAPFLMVPMADWQMPPLRIVAFLLGTLALFAAIWVANQVAARRLQDQIDELDALSA